MGDMFRSEEMVLAQLFVQPEAAYFAISELGESGVVQFKDLNENVNIFQRKFVSEVRRCDEMERKLRYVETEVKKGNVQITDHPELPRAPNPKEIIDLEAHLEKTEGDIKEFTKSSVNLKLNSLQLTEMKHVLEKTHFLFDDQEDTNGLISSQIALITENIPDASVGEGLAFVAGVINRERLPAFETMLWRISSGNVLIKQMDIEEPLEDPATGHQMYKTVFVVFFQGEQLKVRIDKVCNGFHASLYDCPSTMKERTDKLIGVSTRIEDLKLVLNTTQDHLQRLLVNVAKDLQNWSVMVCKMKAIYHTLNSLNIDVTKNSLIGECWIPTKDISVVKKALADGSSACGSSIPSFLNIIHTNEDPPTFHRTNKFTQGFQNLIDSYGMASYGEANPALYTIISFPFLFAVMFGDVGHAVILVCAGALLVLAEKKIEAMKSSNEIFNIFFGGRYIILLMGIFSIYTGFIYNDIFSKSMNIFGSSWFVNLNEQAALDLDEQEMDPRYDYTGTPYFMGVDPIWQLAKNKIIFLNTYKMKLSIIFGVVHMIFGVCVSVFNFVHFRKYSSILLEFLPQILLLCFLFVWMIVMMFMKWIMYSADKGKSIEYGTSCAPSVLIYFINMMLFKTEEPVPGCNDYIFDGQDIVQKVLVFASLICIPWLLLGKPLYIYFTRKRKIQVRSTHEELAGKEEEEEEEEPMSEVFIHQAIHTIEYVLSTISHTASYLRLWALSLAHAQLSEVLWGRSIQMGLSLIEGYAGSFLIFALFMMWSSFTVVILVIMEGLSAFLHTLRLHWVEFMSKFYAGVGYAFEPFSFKAIMAEYEEQN